jgi:hypothetical protein
MTLTHRLFLGYMVVAGLAAGALLVVAPQARDFAISPYLWILIAMALFELAGSALGKGALGSMIRMEMRLLGFAVAVVLSIIIPALAGERG